MFELIARNTMLYCWRGW